jgi:hypothetical protein
LLAAVIAVASLACSRRPPYPFVTYFHPEPPLTLRLPSNWTSDQVEQEGTSYRYFLAPRVGSAREPAVSTALLVEPPADLDQIAQRYVAGQDVEGARDASRDGLAGKAWRFASPDGARRYSLLLRADQGQVLGLYTQAAADRFREYEPAVDEMEKSLVPERPDRYPEHRSAKLGFRLRVPESWKATRNFSSDTTHLMQFTSPALGAEAGQTVHATLGLTAEPAPGGGLEGYYKAVRGRLGDAFAAVRHEPWKDGYVDLERTETQFAVSRAKRFYRVHEGRGYVLACEARDDVFHRVSRWCDIIASTLAVGPEVTPP